MPEYGNPHNPGLEQEEPADPFTMEFLPRLGGTEELEQPFQPRFPALLGQAAEPLKPPFEIPAPEPVQLPPPGYERPEPPSQPDAEKETPPTEAPTPLPADTLDESDVRADSLAYQQLGQSKTQLTAQIGHLDARIATAGTPEERQALLGQRQELGQSLQSVTAAQQEAGGRAESGMARIEERAIAGQADARLAQAQEVEQGTRLAQEQSLSRQAKLQEREDSARAQVEADQGKYRQLVDRGPKATAVVSTFASITSEIFRATLENRVADFGAIANQAWQRDRQAFSDERDAARASVQLSGNAVRDLAAQRDAVEAEEAAQKAALLEGAAQRAQLAIAQATTPMDKARAGMVYQGIQQQHEIATAKASAARFEQLQKAEKRQLDAEYKRAQITNLGAEAAKTEAERQKLARRGTGRRKVPSVLRQELAGFSPKDRAAIVKMGVKNPLTGKYIQSGGAPILARNEKKATELEDVGIATKTAIDTLNKIKAIRREYGTGDWVSLGGVQGDAKAALTSWGADVMTQLNNAKGLGALDEGNVRIMEKMLGDSQGLWDNTTQLNAVIQGLEEGFNDKVRGLTGSTTGVNFPRLKERQERTREQIEQQLFEVTPGRELTVRERGGGRGRMELTPEEEAQIAEAADPEKKRRQLEEQVRARPTYKAKGYNPVTGSYRERGEVIDQLEALRQKGAEDIGGPRALELATADVVEKGGKMLVGLRSSLRRVKEDLTDARAAGDAERVARIKQTVKDMTADVVELGEWIPRQRKKVKDQERMDEARRKQRKAAEKARRESRRGLGGGLGF